MAWGSTERDGEQNKNTEFWSACSHFVAWCRCVKRWRLWKSYRLRKECAYMRNSFWCWSIQWQTISVFMIEIGKLYLKRSGIWKCITKGVPWGEYISLGNALQLGDAALSISCEWGDDSNIFDYGDRKPSESGAHFCRRMCCIPAKQNQMLGHDYSICCMKQVSHALKNIIIIYGLQTTWIHMWSEINYSIYYILDSMSFAYSVYQLIFVRISLENRLKPAERNEKRREGSSARRSICDGSFYNKIGVRGIQCQKVRWR